MNFNIIIKTLHPTAILKNQRIPLKNSKSRPRIKRPTKQDNNNPNNGGGGMLEPLIEDIGGWLRRRIPSSC